MFDNNVPVPRAGAEYPVVLGDSLATQDSSVIFASLRYGFRPSSVSRARTGSLSLQQDSLQAALPIKAHPTSLGGQTDQLADRIKRMSLL